MTDWAETLLRVLLDSSLRVALIAVAVAVILRAMRVGSSAVKHAAWTAVLWAMLLMPILPTVVPAISIPVPPMRWAAMKLPSFVNRSTNAS